jgi:hypothetical protein
MESPPLSPSARRVQNPLTRINSSPSPISNGIKRILLTQMIRAKRVGTWFGLSRLQRSFYSLAMRLDVKLRSPELLKALVSVLKTLRQTYNRVGDAFDRAILLAWAISGAAVAWGNAKAREWRNDQGFIRYLAFTGFHTADMAATPMVGLVLASQRSGVGKCH